MRNVWSSNNNTYYAEVVCVPSMQFHPQNGLPNIVQMITCNIPLKSKTVYHRILQSAHTTGLLYKHDYQYADHINVT